LETARLDQSFFPKIESQPAIGLDHLGDVLMPGRRLSAECINHGAPTYQNSHYQ
jgi:hypothetical protein